MYAQASLKIQLLKDKGAPIVCTSVSTMLDKSDLQEVISVVVTSASQAGQIVINKKGSGQSPQVLVWGLADDLQTCSGSLAASSSVFLFPPRKQLCH